MRSHLGPSIAEEDYSAVPVACTKACMGPWIFRPNQIGTHFTEINTGILARPDHMLLNQGHGVKMRAIIGMKICYNPR